MPTISICSMCQRRRALLSPSRNPYKDDYFEIKNKGKQINWVNTVSEVSVERRQIRHPRNKDRYSSSRTTGRYRTRTHCYGGFNQPMTLIRSDDALRHTRHLSTAWQHIKGRTFWLQRQRTWHQRRTSYKHPPLPARLPSTGTHAQRAVPRVLQLNDTSSHPTEAIPGGASDVAENRSSPGKHTGTAHAATCSKPMFPLTWCLRDSPPVQPTACILHFKYPFFSCQGSPKFFCLPDLIRRLSHILLEMVAGIFPSKGQRLGSRGTMKRTRTLIANCIWLSLTYQDNFSVWFVNWSLFPRQQWWHIYWNLSQGSLQVVKTLSACDEQELILSSKKVSTEAF